MLFLNWLQNRTDMSELISIRAFIKFRFQSFSSNTFFRWVIPMTSSNEASKVLTKNRKLYFFPKPRNEFNFWHLNRYFDINDYGTSSSVSPKSYRKIRKITMDWNSTGIHFLQFWSEKILFFRSRYYWLNCVGDFGFSFWISGHAT